MLMCERKIDELGRIVLSKEMRAKLKLNYKDTVQMILEDDSNQIILKALKKDE